MVNRLFVFTNPDITTATIADIPAIVELLNSAYRGESSKKGWTTEAHLIAGEIRSDAAAILQVMQQVGSVFLKYSGADGVITGCVNLQLHGNKIYLGMFSVSPDVQGGGIGKQLLAAAEEYCRQVGCNTIYMTVITARTELVNWYIRHGYIDTGERKAFTDDGKTGKHLQQLEFMVLEKIIPSNSNQ
jgi:ribosomal protein S18 acetylase RimI-like enzyme